MLVDKWYHVAITISRAGVPAVSNFLFYQDGVAGGTQVISGTPPSGEGGATAWGYGKELVIGKGATGWGYFNGQIANVQIYKRVLTYAEIQRNYNAFKNRFGE